MSAARQYTTAVETAPSPRTATTTRMVAATTETPIARTVPFSIVLLGIVTLLVGAWGAAAPYFAPTFGFVADRYAAWTWSQTSLFLALIPGAAAFVAGWWVLSAAARTSFGRRPDLWLLGLLVAACGAWFVVGQYVWPVIDARLFIVPSGSTHFMWKELCFAVGPGVILLVCGAVFMGWALRRQLAVVAERYSKVVERPVTPVADATLAERGRTVVGAPADTMAAPQPAPVVVEPAPVVVEHVPENAAGTERTLPPAAV